MQISRETVFENIAAHQDDLRSMGVHKLQLFGSTARGENQSSSDLDFIVELKKNTFKNFMTLKFFLEDLFECQVDLVLNDAIKPRLRESILQEAVHAPGF